MRWDAHDRRVGTGPDVVLAECAAKIDHEDSRICLAGCTTRRRRAKGMKKRPAGSAGLATRSSWT